MTLHERDLKAWKAKRRPMKYGNTIVKTGEGTFDSQAEYTRWCILKLERRAGLITNLEHHVVFEFEHNGIVIASYEADFVYFKNNKRVVEDKKGAMTPEFRIKQNLMRAFYNIEIFLT